MVLILVLLQNSLETIKSIGILNCYVIITDIPLNIMLEESTALSKNINSLQPNIEMFIKANRNLVITSIEKASICW